MKNVKFRGRTKIPRKFRGSNSAETQIPRFPRKTADPNKH